MMRARAATRTLPRQASDHRHRDPYQVNKARLIERIADLVIRKHRHISDIATKSDRDGMRIVIELKRGAEPQIVPQPTLQAHVDCRKASA